MSDNKTKTKPTHKKVKIVGNKKFVDPMTNEVHDFQVIEMQDTDFNFHKIWISSVIQALEIVGNQKAKLLFWIVEHLNYQNQLIYTYRRIAKESGISYKTVTNTMKALIDCNFLTKINSGAYLINPDCVFKGSHANRMNILLRYSKTLEENKKIEDVVPKSTPIEKYLEMSQKHFEDKLNEKLTSATIEEMEKMREQINNALAERLKANLSA